MNDYLKMRRKQLGFTQDYVARMSGISLNAYSSIEIGTYMPRLFVAFKIARVLNADVSDLFTDIYLNACTLTEMRLEDENRIGSKK